MLRSMLFIGSHRRATFSCIQTTSYLKNLPGFCLLPAKVRLKISPFGPWAQSALNSNAARNVSLMTLFGIQAVAMAHFALVSLRFPCMELRCPWNRNGRLGGCEHLPPWSPPL